MLTLFSGGRKIALKYYFVTNKKTFHLKTNKKT